MVAHKKRPHAAHADWFVETDGNGHITECYGVFGGYQAQAHAAGTAGFINHKYHVHVAPEWSVDFKNYEVPVPIINAASFTDWLKEHNIPVTEMKKGEKLWADRLIRRAHPDHPGQGMFSDGNNKSPGSR